MASSSCSRLLGAAFALGPLAALTGAATVPFGLRPGLPMRSSFLTLLLVLAIACFSRRPNSLPVCAPFQASTTALLLFDRIRSGCVRQYWRNQPLTLSPLFLPLAMVKPLTGSLITLPTSALLYDGRKALQAAIP